MRKLLLFLHFLDQALLYLVPLQYKSIPSLFCAIALLSLPLFLQNLNDHKLSVSQPQGPIGLIYNHNDYIVFRSQMPDPASMVSVSNV